MYINCVVLLSIFVSDGPCDTFSPDDFAYLSFYRNQTLE